MSFAIAGTVASSVGVTVTASATPNTLGSKATLRSAGTYPRAEAFTITIGNNSTGGLYLLNLYQGASDTLIGTIPYYGNATTKFLTLTLPVAIPADVQVRADVQCATGSRQLFVTMVGHEDSPFFCDGASTFTSMIADTATSIGYTTVTAGNNTYGGTQTLSASTAEEYNFLIVYGRDTTSGGGSTAMLRVLDAAAVIGGNYAFPLTNSDPQHFAFPVWATVAASSALTVEGTSASATYNTFRASCLGVKLTASSGSITIGGGMERAMKDGETTASKKRVFFDIRDSAGAGWSGSVTGVKAKLSISGAASANSTNDIVRVTTPLHYVELDNTEAASASAGDVITAWVPADTGRLASTIGTLHVIADDPSAAALTANDIADAVVEGELDVLETYDRTTNTAATFTGPSGVRTLTIGTDAAYEPIASIS